MPIATFETIDRPYDNFLQRSESVVSDLNPSGGMPPSGITETTTLATGSSTAESNGSVQEATVRSDGAMSDVWITNFIRSQNWKPKSVGFFIDGQSGKAEFTNVYVSGNIEALTGHIGGWLINADSLTDVSGTTGMSSAVTGGDDIRFWAGDVIPANAEFSVTKGGYLKAASGLIGGFTITATELYGGIIKTAATVAAGSSGVIMDTAGLRGYDSVLGNTFNLPTNGSAPTFASGIINSTIFNINTNAVLRTSTTVGDGTVNSAGILINNTGLYGCQASQTLANANLKALIDGTVSISGTITANSGSIGSFTIGTYLYTGSKTAYNDANAGVHLGSDGIGFGNNIFTVSAAGAVVATSMTVTGGTITGSTIRTAASGTRVEMTAANNRLDIYNSTPTNIGWFGGAGANGNFMYINQPDTNEDYPPVYVTSAQDSNVINAFNTNSSVSNRPAFRFESNNANSELMFLNQTGDHSALSVTAPGTGISTTYIENTGDAPALSLINNSNNYGTLFLTQNGTSAYIYVASNAAQLTKAGVWADASSKKLKENFENITVLDKLKVLDILKYNYLIDNPRDKKTIKDDLIRTKKIQKYKKTENGRKGGYKDEGFLYQELPIKDIEEIEIQASVTFEKEQTKIVEKHFTPMAEDFNTIFGFGDDKTLSPADLAGVALQAIKELSEEVDSLKSIIKAKK